MWPEKLRLAKAFLLSHPVFSCFAPAFCNLIPVETNDCPTLSTDKYGRLYYSKEYIESKSVPHLAIDLLHEIGHLLGMHFDRLAKYNEYKIKYLTPEGEEVTWATVANVGGDIEINNRIMESISYDGMFSKFPDVLEEVDKTFVKSDTFKFPKGQTAEEYCQLLIKKIKEKPARCVCCCGGSAATGKKQKWELNEKSPVPKLSEQDIEAIKRQISNNLSKTKGYLTGKWKIWLEETMEKTTAKEYLDSIRRLVRTKIYSCARHHHDITYIRPNRRFSRSDVIYPSSIDYTPEVLVIVDTSGSMADKEIGKLVKGELDKITQTFKPVSLIVVDSQVKKVYRNLYKISGVEFIGGGGSSLVEAFSEAEKIPHDVVIVVSDCETDWPKYYYKPVIVLLPKGKSKNAVIPEWVEAYYDLNNSE
jgi:predicted metal-dependent peptidase